MAGATRCVLAVAQQAGSGDERTVAALIAQLRPGMPRSQRHLCRPAAGPQADAGPHHRGFQELEGVSPRVTAPPGADARTTDYVVSRGERLSARLFAAALEAAGSKSKYVDALDVVHTDAAYGQASPDFARTDRAAQRVLLPIIARGAIPIVPGFLGVTPAGDVATLGRGGSDLTATLLARALGHHGSRSGRTCPGSSRPIPASSPTRG